MLICFMKILRSDKERVDNYTGRVRDDVETRIRIGKVAIQDILERLEAVGFREDMEGVGCTECDFKAGKYITVGDVYKQQMEDEKVIAVGDEVMAYWTAGSFGHWSSKAKIVKINKKSVRVELMDDVKGFKGEMHYPKGWKITVPCWMNQTWAYYARFELLSSGKYSEELILHDV